MVWGAIPWRGISKLAIITESLNSDRYIDLLDEYLRPFIAIKYPNQWLFSKISHLCTPVSTHRLATQSRSKPYREPMGDLGSNSRRRISSF